MALMTSITHVLQWRIQRRSDPREPKRPHKVRQSGLFATRLHEVGIAGNRSECYGEYVPGLVHTARHTMGVGCKRSRCSLTFGSGATTCDPLGVKVTR